MKKNPKVSMIIAAYNEENRIEDCVNSLASQSYSSMEILVTDDGSSDRTVELLERLSKKHENVRFFKQNHVGMAQAWNNCFDNSKGDILCIVGADTIAGKNFISDLVKPILSGALGSQPRVAKIKNLNNLWARAKGLVNVYADTTYLMLTRDLWNKAGGADVRKGYSADQSFYNYCKVFPIKVDTELWDHNPETMSHTWKHSKWFGKSMPTHHALAFLVFFPFTVFGKSFIHFVKDPHPRFIYFLPYYYFIKYLAFLVGFFSAKVLGSDVSTR